MQPFEKAMSRAFRMWLERQDVNPTEVDKNFLPLYLERYEQEKYEAQVGRTACELLFA